MSSPGVKSVIVLVFVADGSARPGRNTNVSWPSPEFTHSRAAETVAISNDERVVAAPCPAEVHPFKIRIDEECPA